jgi:P4 family phage/plasmid primase-like protien
MTATAPSPDFRQLERQILAGLDLRREFTDLGIEITGREPNASGWIEARAFGRDDISPSAAVNVASDNGELGRYKDSASGDSFNLWETAVRIGRFPDWRIAREYYAQRAGVSLPAGGSGQSTKSNRSTKATGGLDIRGKFLPVDPDVAAQALAGFSARKPPITIAALEAAQARVMVWPAKAKAEARHQVVMLPYFIGDTLTGVTLWRVDGEPFPAFGKLKPRKIHLLGDSKDSLLVAPGGWRALDSAEAIWKCEGPSDLLALLPILPTGHVAITNATGASGGTKLPLKFLKGKRLNVVHDADTAGQAGAEKFAKAAAQHSPAEVRIVQLPYDISPDHGKDLRDFLAEGHSFDDLQALADDADALPPEKIDAAELDPMDEARQFIAVESHPDGPTLRYHRRSFLRWDGRRYVERDTEEIQTELYRWLDLKAANIKRTIAINIIEAVKSLTIQPFDLDRPYRIDSPPADRRADRRFIALSNGILDVGKCIAGESVSLLPHSPNWFSTTCLPYNFDPAATCPTWERVIAENLESDPERIAIIQEWAGLSLVFDTSFQKFLILVGEGGNGKSVVCAWLTALLGASNVSNVSLESFSVRFQLASTLGKLANIAAEIGEIDKAAEGHLKSFTAGDRMQFERKLKDPIEAVPTARLVLATNNLPRFADRSSGIWRRMIVMPLRVTIPDDRKIPGLDQAEWWDASGEMPGAFNWAMEGLRRLYRQGRFTSSSICNTELTQHRIDSNSAKGFLTQRYAIDPTFREAIATQTAYAEYVKWCEENGYRAVASNAFGKEIRREFPTAQESKVYLDDGRRVPGYIGIMLNSEYVESVKPEIQNPF